MPYLLTHLLVCLSVKGGVPVHLFLAHPNFHSKNITYGNVVSTLANFPAAALCALVTFGPTHVCWHRPDRDERTQYECFDSFLGREAYRTRCLTNPKARCIEQETARSEKPQVTELWREWSNIPVNQHPCLSLRGFGRLARLDLSHNSLTSLGGVGKG